MAPVTRLLSDLPESADAFGSHSRVADAIADMILSEDGGHAIALQGSWGSGKSTIVRLLEQRLEKQVCVFDAWAHEGDPLRRVFLETLVKHCEPKLSKKQRAAWGERCANLRARERSEEKREIPQLSWWALIIAALLLLSPAALLLFNSWLNGDDGTQWWHYIGLAYFVIALIPVGVGVLRCFRRDAGDAVAFVITRRIGRTTTTTKETPEPTSIEFESFFAELLDDTLGGKDERLLIVVDNLDRVLAQHARETWSTLRVFVERMSAGRDRWCRQVWLLVPYDKPSMDRLWAPKMPVGGSPSSGAPSGVASDGPEGGTGAGADARDATRPTHKPAAFLDKTFQIRFEVPPLVLADWKEYLETLLKTAFPDHEGLDERQRVYRLSAILAEHKNRPPTPRHLKLYVNDIGALRRQHGDQFPLHHMAYIAILRRQDEDVRQGLVAGTIPQPAFAPVLGEGVEDHLAALVFNTDDIEKARDLLLRQPILDALASGDVDKLGELASRRGFWPIAEAALPEAPLEWGERPDAAANAARAVLACDLGNTEGRPEAARSVRAFARAISESAVWTSLDENVGAGIAAAMTLGHDETTTCVLFERVLAGTLVDKSGDDAEEHAEQWAKGLVQMLRAAADLGHARCYVKTAIGCEASVLLHVLSALHDIDAEGRFWRFLRPTADGQQILAAVLPEGLNKPWEPKKRAAVAVLLRSHAGVPWPEFANKCGEHLRAEAVSPPNHVAELIQALRDVGSKANNVASIWKTLASGGHLLHHFNACRDAAHAIPGAEIFRGVVLHVQIAKAAPGFASAPQGLEFLKEFMLKPGDHPELLEAVYSLIVADSDVDVLRKLVDHKAAAGPLAAALVNTLVDRSDVSKVVAPSFFVQVWRDLHSLTDLDDADFERLLSALVEAGDLLEHLVGTAFQISDAALLHRLLSVGGFDDEPFARWISDGLAAVTQDAWSPELASCGDGLRLLLEYRQRDQDLLLGPALADALEAFGGEVMRGQASLNSDHVQAVRESIKALPAERRAVLGKELLDVAARADGGIAEDSFGMFGEILATAIARGEHQNALRCVLTPIVQGEQIEAGTWMAELFQAHPKLRESFPPEDVEDLKERVLGALGEESGFSAVAERLRAALGLEAPTPDEDPEQEDDA